METTSKHRECSGLHRKGINRRRSEKAKNEICTPDDGRHTFLKYQFLPLVQSLPAELYQWRKVERDFFSSLSNLANLYQFTPVDVSDKVFPDNIRCAYADAQKQLKERQPDLGLFIVQNGTHTACLHTGKGLDTGMTLYYIPVRPLWLGYGGILMFNVYKFY